MSDSIRTNYVQTTLALVMPTLNPRFSGIVYAATTARASHLASAQEGIHLFSIPDYDAETSFKRRFLTLTHDVFNGFARELGLVVVNDIAAGQPNVVSFQGSLAVNPHSFFDIFEVTGAQNGISSRIEFPEIKRYINLPTPVRELARMLSVPERRIGSVTISRIGLSDPSPNN